MQNQAEGGTAKISQPNLDPTQLSEEMAHPVLTEYEMTGETATAPRFHVTFDVTLIPKCERERWGQQHLCSRGGPASA